MNNKIGNYPVEIPETWKWFKIKEIGEVITGNTPSKKNQEYYGSDYPFFKPPDLDAGYFLKSANDSFTMLMEEST